MNKRRRYKAKARRAEARARQRLRRPATFPFWRSGVLPMRPPERQQAFTALTAVMRDLYARCECPSQDPDIRYMVVGCMPVEP